MVLVGVQTYLDLGLLSVAMSNAGGSQRRFVLDLFEDFVALPWLGETASWLGWARVLDREECRVW